MIKNSNSMLYDHEKTRGMGIALRIALLSWTVTLITLLIFVLMTIPQQKQTFLQNLESKANSVGVSLHDVAAGAAVNEDYASVVSACQILLAGDAEIDFLIVMKNDGFALINVQSGWELEPSIDSYWRPGERTAGGRIVTAPLFEQRTFHYAQPFDYSGSETKNRGNIFGCFRRPRLRQLSCFQ